MCESNSPQFVCGVPVDWHYSLDGRVPRPVRLVRFCRKIRATILFFIVQHNVLPPRVTESWYTSTFLPALRKACNLDHGPDFAAVVHDRFEATVRDYITRWAGRKSLWVLGLDGTYQWNQGVVRCHFQSIATVLDWLPPPHADTGGDADATGVEELSSSLARKMTLRDMDDAESDQTAGANLEQVAQPALNA
ncbi:hypothetical protein QBC39DRAFT_376550 [Podospora conica]|nr:hypothetical protein QBC39DRAFT_376550 [Schizothecium conicum]